MAGKPIATVGSMHVCPMCSGLIPHVGGPIVGPGAPNVLINGKPAALMGDMCVCVGPPDVVAQGNPSVLISGVPVVCQGDMTAHGGIVMSGEPNILISTSAPSPTTSLPINEIPFPEITIAQKMVSSVVGVVTGADLSQDLRDAQTNQDAIREEAEKNGVLPDIDFSH
ncbi:PAAR domain-containing protein [Labilibaculum antarcticum]|uniref:PAAR repeat-containing protein n=1 Tax=Labilibaculum antarcticum TaxID=1717717 RepID=A0A1Y1CF86_9BACT|nr:PAAR domain-containing protein [Labilibaculum antarcticum]BAX78763.1 PAAR repeat-containing protein [Labilibaculum antarcticum]